MATIEATLDGHDEVTPAFVFESGDPQFGGDASGLLGVQAVRKSGTSAITIRIEGGIVQSDGSVSWHNFKNVELGASNADEYGTQTTIPGTAWRCLYDEASATDKVLVLMTHSGPTRLLD